MKIEDGLKILQDHLCFVSSNNKKMLHITDLVPNGHIYDYFYCGRRNNYKRKYAGNELPICKTC